MTIIALRRRVELDPIEHRRLHEQAVLIAKMFPEFFPDVVRPSGCLFDHHDEPPAGTLAAFMRAHAS